MLQYISIVLLLLTLQWGPGSTPQRSVERFKKAIDENNMLAACFVMMEEDGTGPLRYSNYEEMARSLEGLEMWRSVPFTYGTTTYSNEERFTATVKVEVKSLSQEVRFVLQKFGNSWYIFDIEIFYR